ncbi:MAG: hypothetical protein HYS27_01255 [Deltaproteobacteria bacterium]|nr:hypothetical protein [Deltaproteobacteria bacterium]
MPPVTTRPHKPPKVPRAPSHVGSTRNKNLSARGIKLLEKLEKLGADYSPGAFSLTFQEVKHTGRGGWMSSLVGVKAVDKLQHGIEGGRKMRVYLMVRTTGRGIKRNAAGQATKRVPAKGVKPIVVSSLKDIETYLRDGTKAAKAAWAERKSV